MRTRRAALLACVGVLVVNNVVTAQETRITADDVGRIYAEARQARAFEAFVARYGVTVDPRSTEILPVVADSFGTWVRTLNQEWPQDTQDESTLLDPFENWTAITPEERPSAQQQFDEVQWAYLGNNYFTTLDTILTAEIRARMERQFGPPTKTIVEQEFREGRPVEAIQFEYWMVVNDSISVIFMDTGGPFDRGILVAGDHRYRDELYRIRQTLLGAIMTESAPEPHVDYFFHSITERWYRTGFNGEDYFIREIRWPNLALGRPTLLESDQ